VVKGFLFGIFALLASIAHAEVLELEGTVKSIDREARTISIVRKTSKGEKVLDLEVAKNAGDLSFIEDGDEVSISYDAGLELIASISEHLSGDETLVAGSEWVSEDGFLRLRLLAREGDQYTALFHLGQNGLREVKGSVKGEKLQWLANDVTAHKGARGGDNFGTLSQDGKGPKLDFKWKDRDGNGGDFTLRLVPPKAEPASDHDAITGVYDIEWSEPSGNKGTTRYEFKEDGTFVRAGKPSGKWELADGVIQVRFDDASRGFAIVSLRSPDGLEGTHTKGDGTKSKWKGSKAK
jgi:hypothetical protein